MEVDAEQLFHVFIASLRLLSFTCCCGHWLSVVTCGGEGEEKYVMRRIAGILPRLHISASQFEFIYHKAAKTLSLRVASCEKVSLCSQSHSLNLTLKPRLQDCRLCFVPDASAA